MPDNGNFSYQAKRSARAHTFPTTMMAGVSIPCRSTSCFSVDNVATTRFCPAVVPCCSTAAGISGSIPAPRSPLQISSSAVMPIKNTSVPPVRFNASKSQVNTCPALLCPVIICSEEQKSLCVTGIPLYAGTARGDVMPGTTSKGM